MPDLEPHAAPDLTDDLLRYLQQSRDRMVAVLDGLSEYDVRRPLTPSGTNLLGLLKHLTSVEHGYLCASVGRPAPVRLVWVEDGSEWEDGDMWARAEESRDELVGLYRAVWAQSDPNVRELGLGAAAEVPWWPAERRTTTLGSLLVRMVDETARHAGHADVLREGLDGAVGTPDDRDPEWWRRHVDRIRQAALRHR